MQAFQMISLEREDLFRLQSWTLHHVMRSFASSLVLLIWHVLISPEKLVHL